MCRVPECGQAPSIGKKQRKHSAPSRAAYYLSFRGVSGVRRTRNESLEPPSVTVLSVSPFFWSFTPGDARYAFLSGSRARNCSQIGSIVYGEIAGMDTLLHIGK